MQGDRARCRAMRGDTEPAAAIWGGAVHRDGMQGSEMPCRAMRCRAEQANAMQGDEMQGDVVHGEVR